MVSDADAEKNGREKENTDAPARESKKVPYMPAPACINGILKRAACSTGSSARRP